MGSHNPRSSGPIWDIPGHCRATKSASVPGPVRSCRTVAMAAGAACGSPGSVRHLVGVVVQADDGLPLLDAGQDSHQGRVGHHQVQVVLGEVKVHRLTGIQGDIVVR